MTASNPNFYPKTPSLKTYHIGAPGFEFLRDTVKSTAVTFLKIGHSIFFFKEKNVHKEKTLMQAESKPR